MINWIKGLLVGALLLPFSFENGEDIRYFQQSTIPLTDSTDVIVSSIYDSLSNQDIYQVKTSTGTPVHYYIELQEGVCFENECRPLNILIYWNITGRYLGFELVDGEFLSKFDHEPFSPKEYEELDQLLADPFLPLGNYTFEDLVKRPDTVSQSLDGVSGATMKDVLEYIVPGAAYTTHKLWNVIHGPIQQEVIRMTERNLDSSLLNKILQSRDQSDQTWALERIAQLSDLDDSVVESLVRILLEGEHFQAYLLLKSLSIKQLESEHLQLHLFSLIGKVDFSIENMIFDKLVEAPQLHGSVVDASIPILTALSGSQLGKLLKLYSHHEVKNPEFNQALKQMVPIENSFIERQVLKFLDKQAETSD
ncbi:hypothetical protein [Cyclobacterium qasimii]|uniref:Uncharacterized protein n=2 Tax=Cyclobacterium qasimii TaxID=1350429 RepID=S7VDI8_9BACT|nr:hypothetical protein [Cyclobacterium qasimii]EPR68295.1 hypothetical protein ADICYQ_2765 [Cyclobacterium qasimii M12-11B]GEO19856.1 hypothetical protein CQA01_03900 [Cyclobacterium qasimii]